MYADSVFQLILAIGVGTIFTMLLTKTGLTFPIYIGAMLAAALMRNIREYDYEKHLCCKQYDEWESEFNIMGRDYDAAILVSGTCGFGTGATPNAMANMQAVCDQYVPSIKAYLLIPLVGSLFAYFLNSLVITFFINLL